MTVRNRCPEEISQAGEATNKAQHVCEREVRCKPLVSDGKWRLADAALQPLVDPAFSQDILCRQDAFIHEHLLFNLG